MIEKYVEALAVSLHKGAGLDNQSTTTVAYNTVNGTLYLTHQMNKDYHEVLQPYDRTVRLVWRGNVFAVLEQHPTEGQTLRKKNYGLGGLKKVEQHPKLTQWLLDAQRYLVNVQGFDEQAFRQFVQGILHVKVVLNQDLFVTKSVSTSGLHGESRIIRYHLLKFIRNFEPQKLETLNDLNDARKLIGELKKEFKARFGKRLYFGSSQGACAYCAEFMEDWEIRYGTEQNLNKNRDETWLHPVTMTSAYNDFGFGPSKYARVDVSGKELREWREARMDI